MSVSRLQGEIPIIHEPAPDAALPPFWELEDLVATGLDRDTALAVMAARRVGPRLVDDDGAEDSAGRQAFILRFDLSE